MNTKVFDQINAVNLASQIEPHAARLEHAADEMSKAGIGNHITRGHVAILRHMSACLRADAAQGRLSSIYDGTDRMYAAAEPAKLHPTTSAILGQLGI
jgi:hypothetical protein